MYSQCNQNANNGSCSCHTRQHCVCVCVCMCVAQPWRAFAAALTLQTELELKLSVYFALEIQFEALAATTAYAAYAQSAKLSRQRSCIGLFSLCFFFLCCSNQCNAKSISYNNRRVSQFSFWISFSFLDLLFYDWVKVCEVFVFIVFKLFTSVCVCVCIQSAGVNNI